MSILKIFIPNFVCDLTNTRCEKYLGGAWAVGGSHILAWDLQWHLIDCVFYFFQLNFISKIYGKYCKAHQQGV